MYFFVTIGYVVAVDGFVGGFFAALFAFAFDSHLFDIANVSAQVGDAPVVCEFDAPF